MTSDHTLSLTAVTGIPLIEPGDDLAAILVDSIRRCGLAPKDHDVLVIAQKVVSKAQGRYVELSQVKPSSKAVELAAVVGKDPRLIEIVLSESRQVIRYRPGVLVVEHRLGFVMANAGVDQSNIEHPGGERALLLPVDPDGTCRELQCGFERAFRSKLAVIMSDSFGRPWRNGVVGVAIGAAGIPSLRSAIGMPDLFGRSMRVTEVALADEIASAASLLMGQTDAGLPLVHVSGLPASVEPVLPASSLVRPREQDMFR